MTDRADLRATVARQASDDGTSSDVVGLGVRPASENGNGNGRLGFAAEASELLSSPLDDQTTLTALARVVVPELGDVCAVVVWDEDGRSRRIASAHRDPAKERVLHELGPLLSDGYVDEGMRARLMRGESVVVQDVSDAMLQAVASSPEDLARLRILAPRAAIVAPIIARGRLLGVLNAATEDPSRRYDADDQAALEQLARGAATSIEHARLFEAEQRAREAAEHAVERTSRLQAITAALSRTLTWAEVSDVVVQQGVASLGAAAGSVAMLSASGMELEVIGAVGYEPGVVRRFRRFAVDASLPMAEAARTGQPVFLPSREAWGVRYSSVTGWQFGARHGAWAALPLLIEGRWSGALGLSFAGAREFSDDERAFMLALSQQCAQAFERARLYEAEREARARAEAAQHRFQFLAEASAVLGASLDHQRVLRDLAQLAVPAVGDWCVIDLIGMGGLVDRVAIAHEDEQRVQDAWELERRRPTRSTDASGPGRVIRTGRPELLREVATGARPGAPRAPEAPSLAQALGARSSVSVPLVARGRTIGALTFLRGAGRPPFDAEDLVAATELAGRAALAVDNARLYLKARGAERAKAESLAVLDTLLASAPVGIAFWDRDLRYVRINEALATINGRPAEEHLGKTVEEALPGLAGEVSPDLRSVLQSGEPIVDREVTGQTLRAPGEQRHWLASYYPVRAQTGEVMGLGAVVAEITERKRAEADRERLYRELRQFKETLDTTLDGVYMFDPETLRFFYVNRGAVAMVGYSREELLTMTPVDLKPEYDEARFRDVIAPLVLGQVGSVTLSTTHRRRDGSVLPVELLLQHVLPPGEPGQPGEPGRLVAVARDITDRVEARARLQRLAQSERALNAELKAIIRATDQAVLVFDPPGRVIFANPAADALFGGTPLGRFEHVTSRLDDPENHAPRLGQRRSQGPVELRLRGAVPERWVEVSAYPVVTPPDGFDGGRDDGDQVETILFVRDVTEARRARMARDAFIGVLSHELRTPVTTIYGNTKLLGRADRRLSPEMRREALADIEVESERLYRLVEDLLVLARYEDASHELANEPVLLQRVIPSVIRSEEPRWPLVNFQAVIPANMPAVQGDQTYVEQAVRNLLTNAAKYGGAERPVRIVVEPGPQLAVVRVLDEGQGFANDEGDRLFELFYRSPGTAGKVSGAGIGLFVCRRLVEAMGGRIWARNRPSGGAEFGFALQLFFEEDA